MSPPAAPSARAAWQHAAAAVVLVAIIVTLVPAGPWRPAAEIPLFGLGLAGTLTALHRTPLVVAWRGLALGLLFFALSGVAEVLELTGISPAATGAAESILDIAAYAAMAVGAVGVIGGGPRRRDANTWLDTATLLLAGGLAVLAVSGNRPSTPSDVVELSIGAPVLTVVLLIVCVPLAITHGRRSVSTTALLVAAVLTVAGYGGRIVVGTALRDNPLLDPLPLLAVAALVLAARHPDVAQMGRHTGTGPQDSTTRVLGLGAALLVSPALLLLWTLGSGGAGYVLGAGSTLLTGSALWRLLALNRDRERTRTALTASEARLQLLLEHSSDVIAIVDASGAVIYMNPAVESLLGRPPAEYVGRQAIDLADPRDQPRLRAAVAAGGAEHIDLRVEHSSGGTRWVEMRLSGRIASAGIEGWVVNFREVTDRKMFEDELRRQARTDALTGLLNRTAFSERLEAAMGSLDPAAPPAVLFVDVDEFKSVNDTLGHAAGDDLLATVAARLTAAVRAEDVVARLGGDEFALLLPDADDARLREVADRLVTSLRAPMALSGTTLSVTASIGGALGAPGDTPDRLLHCADTAMYEAKRAGKNSASLLGSEAARAV